jgi:hypothetical protein
MYLLRRRRRLKTINDESNDEGIQEQEEIGS